MAGISVPVVLIPRFTTYLGAADFLSYALDVSAYDALRLTVWRAPLVGTSPVFGLSTYESLDRVTWVECLGPQDEDPGAQSEVQYEWRFQSRWFRLRLALGGTQPGVTCWAQGFFTKRER